MFMIRSGRPQYTRIEQVSLYMCTLQVIELTGIERTIGGEGK